MKCRGVSCSYKVGGATCGPCPVGLVGDGITCKEDACLTRPCASGKDIRF